LESLFSGSFICKSIEFLAELAKLCNLFRIIGVGEDFVHIDKYLSYGLVMNIGGRLGL